MATSPPNIVEALPSSNNLDTSFETWMNAKIHISFWGGRRITHSQYTGSVSLDVFTLALRQVAEVTAKTDANLENRVKGLKLNDYAEALYNISESKLSKCNWFTRLLNFLRELEYIILPYSDRFSFEDTSQYFQSFKQEDCKKFFPAVNLQECESIGPLRTIPRGILQQKAGQEQVVTH